MIKVPPQGNSINYDNLNFRTTKSNLFNKATVVSNYYVNGYTGQLVSSAGFYASDFVPVSPSTKYTIKTLRHLAYYDANKSYISGVAGSPQTNYIATTPANAVYLRIGWYSNDGSSPETQQINKGSDLLPYESFGYVIPRDYLPNNLSAQDVILTLSPTIYALVGQEINIYFDNIISDRDTRYDFDVACSVGAQFDDYYRLTPTVVGTYPITITVKKDGAEIAVGTSSIKVTATTVGNGLNKKVLIIGDSTTEQNSGMVVQKLTSNFSTDAMGITMVGTRGTSPNLHEGKSGWTISQHYSAVDSAFVFSGAFNFAQYMSTNGFNGLNYVVLNLGINDVFNLLDDSTVNAKITEMLTQYEAMIANIKAYDSTIKIGIGVTIPPNYYQDAFGYAYGNGQTRMRYKRNNSMVAKALINQFKGRETEGIYLIPINTNLDTRNNMGSQQVQLNQRNTTTATKQIANGSVHPTDSGFHQIADVYWYWLKSFEV